MKIAFSVMPNLQTNHRLKQPITARLMSCKAWNSPVEYPIWEYKKNDIKNTDGNMLNPISYKKVRGQKHSGRWAVSDARLPVSESLNLQFMMDSNGHKHPSNSRNYHGEIGRY